MAKTIHMDSIDRQHNGILTETTQARLILITQKVDFSAGELPDIIWQMTAE